MQRPSVNAADRDTINVELARIAIDLCRYDAAAEHIEDVSKWRPDDPVVLRLQKDLDVPDEKLNVVGGAIAMGHPLGATGGCLVSTMIDELERRNLKRALMCMCVGGGMGVASIIERV